MFKIPVSLLVFETLVALWGEPWVSQFYTPVRLVKSAA